MLEFDFSCNLISFSSPGLNSTEPGDVDRLNVGGGNCDSWSYI